MVNDVMKDLQGNMDKALDSLKRDLSKVRTGRASLALLDGIKVEYYGSPTPLNQVASMQVADPKLIVIKPWEKSLLQAIEKSIKVHTELGLNPTSDGEVVRIAIPPLTQERRKDLVKVIKKMSEEAKVAVRGLRRDANEMLKELEAAGDISEDDMRGGLKKVQDVTDQHIELIDQTIAKKEKEVLEV